MNLEHRVVIRLLRYNTFYLMKYHLVTIVYVCIYSKIKYLSKIAQIIINMTPKKNYNVKIYNNKMLLIFILSRINSHNTIVIVQYFSLLIVNILYYI